MEQSILQFISDISGIAVLGLFILLLFPLIKVFAKWMEIKLTNGNPPSIYDKLAHIENNHLHEIKEILLRMENKLESKCDKIDSIHDNIIYLKAKQNGK